MTELTQRQSIIWREMQQNAMDGTNSIYIGSSVRRAALLAVAQRLEELEQVAANAAKEKISNANTR